MVVFTVASEVVLCSLIGRGAGSVCRSACVMDRLQLAVRWWAMRYCWRLPRLLCALTASTATFLVLYPKTHCSGGVLRKRLSPRPLCCAASWVTYHGSLSPCVFTRFYEGSDILLSFPGPQLSVVRILSGDGAKWAHRMCLRPVFKKRDNMLIHYEATRVLLFSGVPKTATHPDGITSPVGSISVMNALTITTEGLFADCWSLPWWRGQWRGAAEGVRQLRRSPQAY